jgi:hypothetical protein
MNACWPAKVAPFAGELKGPQAAFGKKTSRQKSRLLPAG